MQVGLVSCDGTKYVADGELLLMANSITSTDATVDVSFLNQYLRQQPNTKWFSSLKIPLGIYSMSGRDTTRFYNRWLKNWGEKPVTMDSMKIEESCRSLTTAMQNKGYLDAEVVAKKNIANKRVKVNYCITPNARYTIRSLKYNIADSRVDSLFRGNNVLEEGLHEGDAFSVDGLHAERKRLASWLNNNGFLYFNKDAITFAVDSCKETKLVDVTMNLGLYRHSSVERLREHPRYKIRNVIFQPTQGNELTIREATLDKNTLFREGQYYSAANIQSTYNRFSRLQAVRSVNVHFDEIEDSAALTERDKLLDARVHVVQRKPHSVSIEPEGTNTAGDFGAAIALTYENRNIFHGSEVFSLQARGAYEAIKGLEGYNNSGYKEFGIEAKLAFPEVVIPGVTRDFHRRHYANTDFIIRYNSQKRPEFQRRLFSAALRYRWQSQNKKMAYQFDLCDINYISMPWISETFKHDYLDSVSNRNAILRYNYEDLLVMKIGFGFTYTDSKNSLKFNIETAGNTLALSSRLFRFSKDDNGKYKVADVEFAQYAKLDVDYTHLYKLDYRNSLALHARVGVAVPYGNSEMLPFEKRYFAGGANNVRGWSVRTLGPGRYHGSSESIDFINRTGDMRIDLNAELRTNLFWKFQGALFIDAGNIWTLKNYEDQKGGQFTLRSIYDEMAVAYGVGIRLLYDYFVLRLDLGMKAINPDYTNSREHFPILHHRFSRDYALHFAVGLPF